jgi:hypothetical protein
MNGLDAGRGPPSVAAASCLLFTLGAVALFGFADKKMARSAIVPSVFLIGGAILEVLTAILVITGFILSRH